MITMIKWDGRYCVPNGYDFWYDETFSYYGLWKVGEYPYVYARPEAR